ncbi:GNAT family N-acetyltransferase [Polycladomyces subterraneus]|uniref:GNAT family N-acetyltransferase n=1 Tax=Polycladomyces subterraneus TaxID=1016997 RepID=A0ABT8IP14_9BACL|nr:GNAT family N-acetyltransferase [Polycladomyces subterraneus]MDN4594545.1 GNAT family N-acetyltransferase [Polycladomyces subterraneus]
MNKPAIFEKTMGPYRIFTDSSRLQVDVIHRYLSEESYWARGIPMDLVVTSIQHSLCFGMYDGESQIGFARVVTDFARYAYLCDVFVLPEYRGQGLGKWLVETVVSHPSLARLARITLGTRDAHGLYAQYGFQPLRSPERHMELIRKVGYGITQETVTSSE